MPTTALEKDAARLIERYRAYAAAFDAAYEHDDWTMLEPHFTEDATSELNGARVDGRAGILASFRDAVAMFDRRFDTRAPRYTQGPAAEDGRIHTTMVSRYERAGLPPLEVIGEEWFTFRGDRIAEHVDRVLNGAEVMGYLAQHADALRPYVQPRAEPATPPTRPIAAGADTRDG